MRNKIFFIRCCSILFVLGCCCISFSQENIPKQYHPDSLLSAAREIMGSQTYCALMTMDSSGKPNIRTMNPFPPEQDMTVWMATNSRSRKAEEIRRNPNVCLYYADHAHARGYVSIRGKAYLTNDSQEIQKRKRDYWTQAFPDWKLLMLIKVVPEKIEVINYRHGIVAESTNWDVPTLDYSK